MGLAWLIPIDIHNAMTDSTVLVSVMFANNEVGTIPDIEEIGGIARDYGALFHTDAAQAVGHTPINVEKMNIDLMSFSSHKIYGPKGIGALYVRGVMPRVRMAPMMDGGGQEKGPEAGNAQRSGHSGVCKGCRYRARIHGGREQEISRMDRQAFGQARQRRRGAERAFDKETDP